jgi:hypothetical protein
MQDKMGISPETKCLLGVGGGGGGGGNRHRAVSVHVCPYRQSTRKLLQYHTVNRHKQVSTAFGHLALRKNLRDGGHKLPKHVAHDN